MGAMKLRCLAEHVVSGGPIVAVAPTSAGIVSVGVDGAIALSSLTESRRAGLLVPERRWLHAAVDPSGALVALGGHGEAVSLASIDGTVLRTFAATRNGLIALAFLDAGRTLVCADHKEVYVRTVEAVLAGDDEAQCDFHSAIYSISDHLTRDALLVGSIGGVAVALDEREPCCTHQGNVSVLAVADAGAGRVLFGGDRDHDDDLFEMIRQVNEEDRGSLFAVDLSARSVVSATTTPGTVVAIRCTANRRYAAVGCLEGELIIVDSATLEPLASVRLTGDDSTTDIELPTGDAHRRWSATGGVAFDPAGVLWVGTGGGVVAAYAIE